MRTTTSATGRRHSLPRSMCAAAVSLASVTRATVRANSAGFSTIDATVPRHLDVHLILDNYATHKTALIRRWLAKRPRYHVHFTPTSAAWINLVERWFVELTEKQIRRGIHRSTRELVDAIKSYLVVTNETAKPFAWTKSADEILASVARFCERTSDSGH
jgi:transposase